MKNFRKITAAASVAAMLCPLMPQAAIADGNTAPLAPTGLLTNELPSPLNIENVSFGWIVNDTDRGEVQSAYEIVVTDAVTGETVWDSGKTASSEQSYVKCGTALKEGYPYIWKVKTWDKDGAESPYSEEASFATGITDENWSADWISDGTGGAGAAEGTYNHFWYVRGSGALDPSKTISRALAYVSGEQDYDLYINGTEIGRGQSFDYASETRYQGWDVTDAAKLDTSALTAGAIVRTYGGGQGRAAVDAGFMARINVYYTDGTSSVITTGSDWTVSQSVPFSGTAKRNGEGDFVENYNAQNAQNGFSSADFDASSWTAATVLGTNVTSAITSVTPELSKPTSYEVSPVDIKVINGVTVADFGVVIPGRPEITFKNGTAGRSVTITSAYILKSDGTVATGDKPQQSTAMTWTYVQTDGEQTYSAWDHLGFRYLQIPDCGETFTADTLKARIVHTNVPDGRGSTFVSSNDMLNNVYELMKRSSLYGIQNEFVDTPTREKGQFTDDARNISEASMSTQFEREATKKALDQFMGSADRYWNSGSDLGRYNSVYPNVDGKRDIPEYSVNFPQFVWNYYMQTGDIEELRKAYPYIKNTADYITRNINSSTGLVTQLAGGSGGYLYGIVDWPASGRFGYDWNGTSNGARTTVNMISKHAFDVVALAAEQLGDTETKSDMESRSAALKTAINNYLINSDGLYVDGTSNASGTQVSHVSQHANSYALAFDVAPAENSANIAEYVAGLGMRQGPMSADILVKGLFNSGKDTAALRLLTEPNDYGWANTIAQGGTFTWESWDADGISVNDSQSHAWGATAASDILRNFAGVQITEPGASRVRIAPVYTELTSVNASVSTERGAVGVEYSRSGSSYDIKLTIPANVTADVELPVIGSGKFIEKTDSSITIADTAVTLGSGVYEFSYDGDITVMPEEIEYIVPIIGIIAEIDTDSETVNYTIGNGTYTYYDATTEFVDLRAGFADGDKMQTGKGILWSGSSVGEDNSVADTNRYILVKPKVSGKFSLTVSFDGSVKNNRVYYADFADSADLTVCKKGSHAQAGSDIASGTASAVSIDMTADHSYVIYTYQKPTTISAMSFSIADAQTATTAPTAEPTADPGYTTDTYNFTSITPTGKYDAGEYFYSDNVSIVFTGTGDTAISGSGNGIDLYNDRSYVKFTAPYDGIITVSGKMRKNSTLYMSTTGANGGTSIASAVSSTDKDIRTLSTQDVSAGTTYYFYNSGSNPTSVASIAYSYIAPDTTAQPTSAPTDTPEPTVTPTPRPTAAPTEAPDIAVLTSNVSDGTAAMSVYANAEDGAILIAASYTENGAFYAVSTTDVKDQSADISVAVPKPDAPVSLMLWNSLNGMEPIAAASAVTPYHTARPTLEPESENIVLSKDTYPLVVGNKSKSEFSDWKTRGSSVTLSAEVTGGDYSASDISWSAEDPSIVTVDSKTGKVRGRTTGITKVYANLPNGEKKSCTITVIDNITRSTVGRLELNTDELNLNPGAEADLIPIIYPKDVYGNDFINKSLTWSSSDESVVTVADGHLAAIAAGSAVIKAVSNDIGRTAECIVNVTEDESFEISGGNTLAMTVGDTTQLNADCAGDIVWRSDNSLIADVDANGVVTAYSNSLVPVLADNPNYTAGSDDPLKAPSKTIVFENGKAQYELGTVKLYATSKNGGATAVYEIAVSNAEQAAHAVAISKNSISLVKGTEENITAVILPASLMDARVSWSSSDESVVKVTPIEDSVTELSQAKITAAGAGTAVITAEYNGVYDTCTVTVTDQRVLVNSISISEEHSIDIDESYQLALNINEDATNKNIIWLSTDADKLSVNNEGVISGMKPGVVRVYAISESWLTSDQIAKLEELRAMRTIGELNADLAAILPKTAYAWSQVTVKDSSPYLRNLHAPDEGRTDTSINLLWNRASLLDAGDLDQYAIYCNSQLIGYTKQLGYTINGLAPSTTYRIKVSALDSSGKELISADAAASTKPASEIINVLDYGARGDGKVLDTYAIQKAIDNCPENGTVCLPKGYVFMSGALFLKSNMTFKVDGILLGSSDSKDYPFMVTRWEGWRKVNQQGSDWANTTSSLPDNHYAHSSLINAGTYDEGESSYTGPYNVQNLTICGSGQINANGFTLAYNEGMNQKTGNGGIPAIASPAIDQTIRGRVMTIHNTKGLYVKDVTIAYGPSWTVHPIYCDSITFDGLEVVSKGDGVTGAADDICVLNGDGIDPESSTNVNIFNTYFYTGDDAVAVKTGRNREGNELDRPTAFIRITDCESNGSKGGFAVGSENASGVRNMLMQNLTIRNITLSHGIWFKTYWSRGGLSENVAIRDITSAKPLAFVMNYATSENNPAVSVPEYRYFTIENCNSSLSFAGFKAENGHSSAYVKNVTIRGCGSGSIDYGRDFTIWDSKPGSWTTKNSSNISFMYSNIDTSTDIKVKDGAEHVSAVDLDSMVISVSEGTTEQQLLDEIEPLVPDAALTYAVDEGLTKLTVTSQDGTASAEYAIKTAVAWNFSTYTTEVSTTESGFTESYNGLTIAIANNGADSDHDKISTAGVYWRGGAASGNSTRYISFTPDKDGTLTATGKLNASGGRWGISTSLNVSSLAADSSSTTSTSTETVRMDCKAGTTYYIINKSKSCTVSSVSYIVK